MENCKFNGKHCNGTWIGSDGLCDCMGEMPKECQHREMNKYYITFGFSHAHSINGKTLDRNCVAVIEATSLSEAKEYARKTFKNTYCLCESKIPDMSFYPRGFINLY